MKRLYTSNATKPPNIWDKQYGITSTLGNLPAAAMAMVTAGLMCPPEILEVNKMVTAKAAPMAKGLPVA